MKNTIIYLVRHAETIEENGILHCCRTKDGGKADENPRTGRAGRIGNLLSYAQRNGAADVFLPALYGAVSLRRDLCRAAPVLQQLSHPLCGAGTGVLLC